MLSRCEDKGAPCTIGGMVQSPWGTEWGFLNKFFKMTMRFGNFNSGNVCKENKNTILKRYLYSIFIAASFTIAKTQKQSKCQLHKCQQHKEIMLYSYIGYYSVIKR